MRAVHRPRQFQNFMNFEPFFVILDLSQGDLSCIKKFAPFICLLLLPAPTTLCTFDCRSRPWGNNSNEPRHVLCPYKPKPLMNGNALQSDLAKLLSFWVSDKAFIPGKLFDAALVTPEQLLPTCRPSP